MRMVSKFHNQIEKQKGLASVMERFSKSLNTMSICEASQQEVVGG